MSLTRIVIVLVIAALGWGGWMLYRSTLPLHERLGDAETADRWAYDDWEGARERARAEGRPIMAVFRCVP